MKLLTLAFFWVSAISAFAGIIGDVVVVSAEDVRAGKAPLACSLAAEDDATFKTTIALKEPVGVPGKFASIEFRIMPEKVEYSNLKMTVWDLKRIERRGHSRAKTLDFQLSKDEIPRCLVIVSSWTGERDGMSVLRNTCLPLSALVAR